MRFKDPDAIDLLDKMLTLDAHDRITVSKALEHPFFKKKFA